MIYLAYVAIGTFIGFNLGNLFQVILNRDIQGTITKFILAEERLKARNKKYLDKINDLRYELACKEVTLNKIAQLTYSNFTHVNSVYGLEDYHE